MRHILLLSVILFVTAGFFYSELRSAAASDDPAVDRSQTNDNKRRGRRGRDRDRDRDDDSTSNRSNSNSNSNRSRSNTNDNGADSRISMAAARTIALARVNGTVTKQEYERKGSRWIYEFYIRDSRGETFEVYVDAENGEITKIESRSRR
jgi:uncharacterized membrane protein YkoI